MLYTKVPPIHSIAPMRKLSPLAIVGIIVALLILWLIVSYNGLVGSKAAVDARWADVQSQYQRRVDLVPNLVATVKGAAKFEQETFQEVTAARSAWAAAASVNDRGQQIQAANTFDSALSRLLVTVEAYPQLKATQAFQDLMTQLEGTENRIAVARRDFNGAVQSYNVRVQRFPSAMVARLFGFSAEKFFEAQAGSDRAPSVNF